MDALGNGSVPRSPRLIPFGAVALAQLALVVFHLPAQFAVVSTWLVAPALALWVWRAGGPKLLVLALLLCWVGDVLGNPRLIGLGPGALLLSVAAFAAATVLLLILFLRSGALAALGDRPRRRRVLVVVLYLAASTLALVVTWGSLDAALRTAGVAYLLMLTIMATTAFVLDVWTGIGAALVFVSHLLVVLEVGRLVDGTATVFRLAFWVLYLLGILVISIAVVRRSKVSSDSQRRHERGLTR